SDVARITRRRETTTDAECNSFGIRDSGSGIRVPSPESRFPDRVLVCRVRPDRLDRPGHEVRRIRARPWLELLHAATVDFRHIEVAVGVDAHPVHAPEAAREVAHRAKRVFQMALLIVL